MSLDTALQCCLFKPRVPGKLLLLSVSVPTALTAMAPAGAQMAFTPPCSSTCQYQMGPNRLCRSELLAVPRGPGKSVAITMLEMTDVPKVTAGDVLKALVTKPGQAPAFFQRSVAHFIDGGCVCSMGGLVVRYVTHLHAFLLLHGAHGPASSAAAVVASGLPAH